MGGMKTYQTNPELFEVGTPCEVLMNSSWIGAQTEEFEVWLPAEIIKINQVESRPFVHVCIYESEKYHNSTLDNMLIVPTQLYTIRLEENLL